MKMKVVLDGGLKSCCTTYPPEFVLEFLQERMDGDVDVQVIDSEKEDWTPDHLASVAIEYFGESAFPLIYIKGKLSVIGSLPDTETLIQIMHSEENREITESEIIEAAKKYGLLHDKNEN